MSGRPEGREALGWATGTPGFPGRGLAPWICVDWLRKGRRRAEVPSTYRLRPRPLGENYACLCVLSITVRLKIKTEREREKEARSMFDIVRSASFRLTRKRSSHSCSRRSSGSSRISSVSSSPAASPCPSPLPSSHMGVHPRSATTPEQDLLQSTLGLCLVVPPFDIASVLAVRKLSFS